MTNAELINVLRYCGNGKRCNECPMGNPSSKCFKMLLAAADALEAAERLLDQNTKRCEGLRKQLRESHESYEKRIAELEKSTKLPDRQEFLAKGSFIEEPLSRPKEGEWIATRVEVDGSRFTGERCSRCGWWKSMGIYKYCPNCGAMMTKGEEK